MTCTKLRMRSLIPSNFGHENHFTYLMTKTESTPWFHSGKALNSYAGNDASPYQSGQFESKNRHISKRGSSALRKACYEVMQALKLTKPQDDPVYLFMLKKEQEGKPYNVAKMAAVNKFLRIYYARAMETRSLVKSMS